MLFLPRKFVWIITLTLKKHMSLLTSPKDRGWKGEDLKSKAPPRPAKEDPGPLLSLCSDSTSSHSHRHNVLPPPPLTSCSSLSEWCRVTRTGKHLPRRKRTCTITTRTHSHGELLAESWTARGRHMLHETKLDQAHFSKLKVSRALILSLNVVTCGKIWILFSFCIFYSAWVLGFRFTLHVQLFGLFSGIPFYLTNVNSLNPNLPTSQSFTCRI